MPERLCVRRFSPPRVARLSAVRYTRRPRDNVTEIVSKLLIVTIKVEMVIREISDVLGCLHFRGKVSKTTSMRDFDVIIIRRLVIHLGAEIHANIGVLYQERLAKEHWRRLRTLL